MGGLAVEGVLAQAADEHSDFGLVRHGSFSFSKLRLCGMRHALIMTALVCAVYCGNTASAPIAQ
jgi:hypothetical protein